MERPIATVELGVASAEAAKAAAFRGLVESHLRDAYRLARLVLRDSVEAEDAVHDAFVTAWRKWPTLREPDRFSAWFDRIVVNTCRNRMRANRRWQTGTDVHDLPLPTPDPHAVTRDRDLIGSAFTQLRPDDRIVLALRYYRDLTVDDMALLLATRPGTVKSRLHRALARLRTILEDQGVRGVDG